MFSQSDQEKMPTDDSWRLLLCTDGTLFVSFIKQFVNRIQFIASQPGPIIWTCIPGYIPLIRMFLPLLFESIKCVCNQVLIVEPLPKSAAGERLNEGAQS